MKFVNLNVCAAMLAAGLTASSGWAAQTENQPAAAAAVVESIQPADIKPLTKEEIQQGMSDLSARQNQRIEEWGKTLKPEDFERSWFGRILKKPKRQEVCGIYQEVLDETLKLAVQNQDRLSEADRKLLQDRNLFIQALGYKNNIVDTQMGFNCRLR